MYIRDHLEGAFSYWKKQNRPNNFTDPWIGERDFGLLRLIDEHVQLKAGEGSNWYSTFRSSVDLKEIIKRDLHAKQPSALLQRMIEQNKVPELRIICAQASGGVAYLLEFQNHGAVAAHKVTFQIITQHRGSICQTEIAQTLPPGVSWKKNLKIEFQTNDSPFAAEILFELADGMQIGEFYHCDFKGQIPVFTHKGKWLIGETGKVFAAPFYPWK